MSKIFFFLLTLFGHVLTILAWTKCRLVAKHILSITHFHSCFFLTFSFKFYLYKIFKLSIKAYLLLIYTFMCLGMAWNWYGLYWSSFNELSQKTRFQSVPIPALCLYNIQRENLVLKNSLCILPLTSYKKHLSNYTIILNTVPEAGSST